MHFKSCQKEKSTGWRTQRALPTGCWPFSLSLWSAFHLSKKKRKKSWRYCLSYVEKSPPLWIPCFSVNSRFITGWQLQARWLSQTFSLMNYTLTRTKPQTRLYHLKGRRPRPKNSLQFPPKKEPKRETGGGVERENKGKTCHNGGSGLSWSHRQCGFYQRHNMLVSICQLRLHVVISKVVLARGSTGGLEVDFYPLVVIKVLV